MQSRQAFTLLEVILALAILAGSVAILGEVMRSAGRSAADAQAETRAQILACSIMDEMVTGVVEPTQQSRAAIDVDDIVPWVYSVTFGTTPIENLMSVELVVEQDLDAKFDPVKFRLVRWLPSVTEAVEEDEEEQEESEEQSEESADSGAATGGENDE